MLQIGRKEEPFLRRAAINDGFEFVVGHGWDFP
jgi:hypothetical protein